MTKPPLTPFGLLQAHSTATSQKQHYNLASNWWSHQERRRCSQPTPIPASTDHCLHSSHKLQCHVVWQLTEIRLSKSLARSMLPLPARCCPWDHSHQCCSLPPPSPCISTVSLTVGLTAEQLRPLHPSPSHRKVLPSGHFALGHVTVTLQRLAPAVLNSVCVCVCV